MAFIYETCRTSPLSFQCPHDPDAKKYYSFRYRAPAWSSDTAKKEKSGLAVIGDIVRPSTANGFYYECTSGGITDAAEPNPWGTITDATTTDNDVEWTAIPDDLLIQTGDTLTSSDWEVDDVDVILDNDAITGFDTYVRVTAVPVDTTSFVLRNVVVVTRSGGKVEEFNRTIKVKIKEQ